MPSLAEMMPSPYINQEDLKEGPVNIKIAGCKVEDVGDKKEKLYCLSFVGTEKRFILKPTNIILLGGLHGEPGENFVGWINKVIQLYIDPTIIYGGKRVGGIRIDAPLKRGPAAPETKPIPKGPGEVAASELKSIEMETQTMPTDPDDGIDNEIPF